MACAPTVLATPDRPQRKMLAILCERQRSPSRHAGDLRSTAGPPSGIIATPHGVVVALSLSANRAVHLLCSESGRFPGLAGKPANTCSVLAAKQVPNRTHRDARGKRESAASVARRIRDCGRTLAPERRWHLGHPDEHCVDAGKRPAHCRQTQSAVVAQQSRS